MTALLIGLASALLAACAAVFMAALIAAPRGMPTADLLRMYPDLMRLLIDLAKDNRVASSVRWRLLVAAAYNLQPINLIPDFVPIVGFVDNIIVIGWAVRSAIRTSGAEVVLSHWRGSPACFVLVCRLCRLPVVPVPRVSDQADQLIPSDCHARPDRDLAGSSASRAGRFGPQENGPAR